MIGYRILLTQLEYTYDRSLFIRELLFALTIKQFAFPVRRSSPELGADSLDQREDQPYKTGVHGAGITIFSQKNVVHTRG